MTTKKLKTKSEHSEQVQLVMHLRVFFPEVMVAAIPNGANVMPAHRIKLVAEGLLAGMPDLVVLEPRGNFHGLFVELKSTAKSTTISDAQIRIAKKLSARNYKTIVAYGFKDALTQIKEYLLT